MEDTTKMQLMGVFDEATEIDVEGWEHIVSSLRRHGFRREMYGSWLAETEPERKLREIAETYHTGCNAYDRRVCSGISPRTGEAMPVTPDEMRLSNGHALKMRDAAIAQGYQLGFSRKQVEEAIRKWIK